MKRGKGSDKELRKETAIKYLLDSPTVDDAAKKLDMAPRTLRNWLADPEFRREYQLAQRQCLEHAIARSQSATTSAIVVLQEVMLDFDTNKGSERVAAAKVLLDFAQKGVEYHQMRSDLDDLKAELAALRGQADGRSESQKGAGETATGS